MRLASIAALSLLCLPLGMGCAPKLLPNSDIRDTQTNRAILDVILAYRNAMESRNPDALMKLVSQTFFEDSGRPESSDHYDYAGLDSKLRAWAAATKSVRITIQVKSVFSEGDRARARYFFDLNYQIPGPENVPIWKRDSDTKEMTFRQEGGVWRITGGI